MTRQQRITRADALFALLNRLRGEDFGGHPECAETDPEVFFPVSEEDARNVSLAKEICARCEISTTCLEAALRNGEHGIWGGTTDEERAAMRRSEGHEDPGTPMAA